MDSRKIRREGHVKSNWDLRRWGIVIKPFWKLEGMNYFRIVIKPFWKMEGMNYFGIVIKPLAL